MTLIQKGLQEGCLGKLQSPRKEPQESPCCWVGVGQAVWGLQGYCNGFGFILNEMGRH